MGTILRCLALGMLCLGTTACSQVLPDGRRMDEVLGPGPLKPNLTFREACFPPLTADLPVPEGAKYVDDEDQCLDCHDEYQDTVLHRAHRELRDGQSCEACHGPGSKHVDSEGKEPGSILSFRKLTAAQRSEACGRCHERDACGPESNWRTAVHTHKGVSCLECHRTHGPPPDKSTDKPADGVAASRKSPVSRPEADDLLAGAPDLCYRCHGEMRDLQHIAGPHQIGGPNGFRCTTCHDPHGRIREESRQDLCLTCHRRDTPTLAWHSSMHAIAGVACTDCHHPHPSNDAEPFAEIRHTSVISPQRRAMSVQEPEACYRCHPQIFGRASLPSHHPIQEGKMVCSDCHDAHGEADKGLREPTLNMVCYRCHAEKQGPFAYEHPPVTEDCGICHEPHGTVTNDLLREPATFLCLRCHSGHRSDHRKIDDPSNRVMRQAMYADCTQCHAQVHGSDLINETLRGRGLTR